MISIHENSKKEFVFLCLFVSLLNAERLLIELFPEEERHRQADEKNKDPVLRAYSPRSFAFVFGHLEHFAFLFLRFERSSRGPSDLLCLRRLQ